jgi:conjugal transfer pilus assembly protein TraE
MLFKKYTDKLVNGTDELRFYRIVIGGLLIGIIMLARTNGMLAGDVRTVITPPEIKRSFWVSSNDVSQEYLEEMAYWYAGLALNITPQGSEYQRTLFLKYADPEESGRLTAEASARAEFLRRNGASTVFAPRTIAVDMPHKRVALTGVLSTYVADKRAPDRSVVYMIAFNYRDGTLYVSDFKETSAQDPFGDGSKPSSH